MAIYELGYQRLAERPRRHESPAVAIAISDLRLLARRKSLRLATFLLGSFTLAVLAYIVFRNGLIDQLLPAAWHEVAGRLPAVDVAFFDAILRSGYYQFLLVLLTLFVGSGRIAEDLRAGALTIYLAKPVTRTDYLLGKVGATAAPIGMWALGMPLLLLLTATVAAPGFLAANLRLVAAALLLGLATTAYHTAAILFFSSGARSGRVAGVLFGALYFVSGSVEAATNLALRTKSASFLGYNRNLDTLAAHLFGTAGPGAPALAPAVAMIVLVVVIGLGAARRRVKAVEVVA